MANEHIPQAMIDKFRFHEAEHQQPMTKKIHLLVNPLVFVGTFGLFAQISISDEYYINGGAFLVLLNFLYYVRLDWKIASLYTTVAVLVYFMIYDVSLEFSLICFFLGWGLGFFSHKVYEKNRPAVTNNIKDLLVSVGPLHMLACLIGYYKPPGDLKQK